VQSTAGEPFILVGLTPLTRVALDVATTNAAGVLARDLVKVTTVAAEPHVVINEVLAHPLGPKPAEEWVELLNDGSVATDLTGYVLVVAGSPTPLPSNVLAPHEFALIITPTFVAEDGLDPSAAPGTLLLQVDRFGKRGLSDSGTQLVLTDASGTEVSSFPAVPKPKAGRSVARRTPACPDADPSCFSLATPTPGGPNGG
jgi:hypothetical protein